MSARRDLINRLREAAEEIESAEMPMRWSDLMLAASGELAYCDTALAAITGDECPACGAVLPENLLCKECGTAWKRRDG